MIPLKYNTASQEVILGPFLDDTDGKTGETALTIANTDIKIWKTGATSEVNKNSGGATHIANGRYYAVLDATDTNTYGPMEINVSVSGALPVKVRFVVMNANAYDALYAASGGSINTNVTAIASNVITAASIASDAGTEIASAVTSALGTGSSLTSLASQSSVDAVDNFIDTEIASIISTLSTIDGKIDIVDDYLDTELAAANTKLDTIDNFLDTEISSIKTVTDNLATAIELDGAVYRFTTNALEQAPTGTGGGTGATASEIAEAVWDEALSGHATAGTAGAALTGAGSAGDPWSTALPGAYSSGTAGYIMGTNLDGTVSSRASQTSVTTIDDFLDTEVAAIKAKTDNLPTDPADASVIAAALAAISTKVDTVDNYLDTEISALTSSVSTISTNTSAASIRTALGLGSADLDTQLDNVVQLIENLSQATVIKNEAYPNFGFTMKLSSDHASAATGKTVTGQRRLDNGSLTSVSGTITEIGGGLYEFDALAADTNCNSGLWIFSADGCDDEVWGFKTSV